MFSKKYQSKSSSCNAYTLLLTVLAYTLWQQLHASLLMTAAYRRTDSDQKKDALEDLHFQVSYELQYDANGRQDDPKTFHFGDFTLHRDTRSSYISETLQNPQESDTFDTFQDFYKHYYALVIKVTFWRKSHASVELFTSVPIKHLPPLDSSYGIITIHLSSSHAPIALSYDRHFMSEVIPIANDQIKLDSPVYAASVLLGAPPPALSNVGQPQDPAQKPVQQQQKSFLQKHFLLIFGVALLIMNLVKVLGNDAGNRGGSSQAAGQR